MTGKTWLLWAGALAVGMGAWAPVSAEEASTDVTEPVHAAALDKGQAGATPSSATLSSDGAFTKLFATWQALDTGAAKSHTLPNTLGVSIPTAMPLLSTRGMSSGFGMRVHPILGGWRAHRGVDLPASYGSPIRATADGVVSRADWFGGYGLCVQLDHGAAMATRYGHMSRIAVVGGQQVHKGDVIGYVGSTGRSTGPHLHYEVRIGGEAVNPLPYISQDDDLRALSASGQVLLAADGEE